MQIVFFGTPDFAVSSLRALLGEGFDISAVVTQPDRPRGRSHSTPLPPPVKVVAQDEGLPVLQPANPNTPDFVAELASHEPDLGVVVAYGHILKRELLTISRLGMVNVHASLLPKLRGAAPIQHAILSGLDRTGVSIMQMDEGMDSGPVIMQVPTRIAPDETFGELQSRLAELGALALIEALMMIGLGKSEPTPQDHAAATRAPKIDRESAKIDWTHSAPEVARKVRAMDPTPGAWTTLDASEIKLFGPSEASWPPPGIAPGQILEAELGLVVATAEGALRFLDVQPAGKRRMPAADWIRGRGAAPGQTLQ